MSTARLHSQSITKSDARNYLWYEKRGHACNSKSNMKNITGLLHERFHEKMGATQTQKQPGNKLSSLYIGFSSFDADADHMVVQKLTTICCELLKNTLFLKNPFCKL